MRKISLMILVMTVAVLTRAQTAVSGMIKDLKGKPIAGASITLKDTYDGATSDSTGRFSFKTDEKGDLILIISAVGYKGIEQTVSLAGKPLDLPVSLKEEINEMKAV